MTCAARIRTLVAALLALLPLSSQGQNMPAKPIHLLSPYSAGSGPDVGLRIIADRLSKTWNQAVLVETRSGANGIVAVEGLKKLPADGSGLALLDDAITAINPFLYASLPYSPEADLTPISMVMDVSFAIMVTPSGPFKTFKDLIAYAKNNPGKLSYGVPMGIGHPAHLGMERLKVLTGTDITLVPYKASGPMLTDVGAGTLPMAWASYPSTRSFLQAGTVRPLATGAKSRDRNLPEVPTIVEAGGPESFVVDSWMALFGPRGLSRDLTAAIARDVAATQGAREVADKITGMGYGIVVGGPDALQERMRADAKKNGDIIRRLNIKID